MQPPNPQQSNLQRPNILFIMADQWAAASVACYGCDVTGITPNLDALSQRGIRFNRHYANAPVCGPSRACIFSGRSPVVNGVLHNNIEPNPNVPYFPLALREAGYRTNGIGKFHFTPMQTYPPRELSQFGFDEVLITEDPKHGPWLEWVKREHPSYYEQALAVSWPMPYIEKYPPQNSNLRRQWEAAYEKYLAPLRRASSHPIFHQSPLPAELHQTSWIADCAVSQLEKFGREHNPETPFFQFVSFVDPHDPYDPPVPYANLFDPREIPPPIPQQWSRDWCPRDYARFQDTMFEISDFDAKDWQRLRANFYGSCRFVDESIGRILKTLNTTGLDESTLVVFTTDHGDMIGDHGLLMKGPWHYDKTIRCPLIVSGPNVAQNGVCDALTCTLDFAPTFLNAAGIKPNLEGRALPLQQSELETSASARKIVIETNASYVNQNGGARSLLSEEGFRLTLFPDEDYGELFDLRHDPAEQHNLFNDPLQQPRRMAMAEQLISCVAQQIYPFQSNYAEM